MKVVKPTCHVERILHSVHHVIIENAQTVFNEKYFPNATELTLGRFGINDWIYFIRDGFHHLFPTEKLTKLTINHQQTTFHEVIKMLLETPNIHTLTVACPQLIGKDLGSLQKSETYRIISKKNKIRNMTLTKYYTLRTIQMLVDLFPQLQHLTLCKSQKSVENIARFLLTKYNNIPCHVSSLCIHGVDIRWTAKLKFVVESQKHVDDYSLKVVNQKLYLWW